jgi:hypothetical protein
MIDGIKINATLPTFQGNFEEVKIKLSEGLKLYEIGVTADNLKDANAMATEPKKETPALTEEPKIQAVAANNGMFKITAIFELKANSEAEAVEMAKDLFSIMGYQAEIKAA